MPCEHEGRDPTRRNHQRRAARKGAAAWLHAPNVRVRNVKEANIPATKPMNWQPRTITTALVCETPSVNVTCNGNSEQLGRLERGLQSSRHS
ncbi:hypothetical protein VFPBJ_08642 [Purpureocillium lilacinum]|uniref:Uncharacterized protein n=1 Tax=Purpureocillium lilacinum TaxID=33203 RepID=A0A179GEM3_PURLI|nr:hypothetical protein VFPBJ_08642 [Purpureocillium lilacinum]